MQERNIPLFRKDKQKESLAKKATKIRKRNKESSFQGAR